jgi:hypothetical protein
MEKIILRLFLAFLFIAFLGLAAFAQTPSFEVESYTLYSDSVFVKTVATKVPNNITLFSEGKEVKVIKTWTIFIAPKKTKRDNDSIKEVRYYLLANGQIIAIPRKNNLIERDKIVQLDSLIRARDGR